PGVARMAVHVLEGVQPPVTGRHELDHSHLRMRGMARRLLERVPAYEVGLDLLRQLRDEALRATPRDELAHPLDTDEIDHDASPVGGPPASAAGSWIPMVVGGQTKIKTETCTEQAVSCTL